MGNTLNSGGTRGQETMIQIVIPTELWVEILSFIPARDLIRTCKLVCSEWKEMLDSKSFWKFKCEKEGKIRNLPLLESHLNSDFVPDYQDICLKDPFRRNLIKNWNAEGGLQDWTIVENGGDRFCVEPDKCIYADPVHSIQVPGCSKCWATSYGWCVKKQVIDLWAEGLSADLLDNCQPFIHITEWCAARKDCACVYQLEVTLSSSSGHQQLDIWQKKWTEQQWAGGTWNKISHTFRDYGKDMRYVTYQHAGKDTQFWAGHYGPKIAASSVEILLENPSH